MGTPRALDQGKPAQIPGSHARTKIYPVQDIERLREEIRKASENFPPAGWLEMNEAAARRTYRCRCGRIGLGKDAFRVAGGSAGRPCIVVSFSASRRSIGSLRKRAEIIYSSWKAMGVEGGVHRKGMSIGTARRRSSALPGGLSAHASRTVISPAEGGREFRWRRRLSAVVVGGGSTRPMSCADSRRNSARLESRIPIRTIRASCACRS